VLSLADVSYLSIHQGHLIGPLDVIARLTDSCIYYLAISLLDVLIDHLIAQLIASSTFHDIDFIYKLLT
jgi:hypothetical protein